jgi:hypothetical protein
VQPSKERKEQQSNIGAFGACQWLCGWWRLMLFVSFCPIAIGTIGVLVFSTAHDDHSPVVTFAVIGGRARQLKRDRIGSEQRKRAKRQECQKQDSVSSVRIMLGGPVLGVWCEQAKGVAVSSTRWCAWQIAIPNFPHEAFLGLRVKVCFLFFLLGDLEHSQCRWGAGEG